ncbi:P-loop containing nucleoside triphosphate hydrolase protein [Nemania sp. NC0429]|nr:P-loop containing nucleoside triphosphate hydrolase protein [Nemania sp. NC0429]
MIRRPTSIITLPSRQDRTKIVEFSSEERREYQKIENSLWQPLGYGASYSSEKQSTMNTIQLINKLRRFCNLGVCSITMPMVGWQTSATTPKTEVSVDTAVASGVALGDTTCRECGQIVDVLNSQSTADPPIAYYSECCKLYCGSCAELGNYRTSSDFPCCKVISCVLRPLSLKAVHGARNEQPLPEVYPAETSKIRSLVQEILSFPLEKHVVFSFWTSSLTLAQRSLAGAGIRCLRIEGSDSLNIRERTIQEFREDQGIKVILVSISCGGVGLDLTVASRAHLLEPQWNPAIEEQALSRVHRMGQRRPVVTMRYVMKDSIEESVASLKGKKQLLAELLPQTALDLHLDEI